MTYGKETALKTAPWKASLWRPGWRHSALIILDNDWSQYCTAYHVIIMKYWPCMGKYQAQGRIMHARACEGMHDATEGLIFPHTRLIFHLLYGSLVWFGLVWFGRFKNHCFFMAMEPVFTRHHFPYTRTSLVDIFWFYAYVMVWATWLNQKIY